MCTISSYFLKSNQSALKFCGLGHSSPVHSLKSQSFVANKYFTMHYLIVSLVLLCFSITILFHLLCSPEDRHTSASRFTRNVDIFQKMFLFIPVCRRYFLQIIIVYNQWRMRGCSVVVYLICQLGKVIELYICKCERNNFQVRTGNDSHKFARNVQMVFDRVIISFRFSGHWFLALIYNLPFLVGKARMDKISRRCLVELIVDDQMPDSRNLP